LPAELISFTSLSLKELLNYTIDFSFINKTSIRGLVHEELALDIYV